MDAKLVHNSVMMDYYGRPGWLNRPDPIVRSEKEVTVNPKAPRVTYHQYMYRDKGYWRGCPDCIYLESEFRGKIADKIARGVMEKSERHTIEAGCVRTSWRPSRPFCKIGCGELRRIQPNDDIPDQDIYHDGAEWTELNPADDLKDKNILLLQHHNQVIDCRECSMVCDGHMENCPKINRDQPRTRKVKVRSIHPTGFTYHPGARRRICLHYKPMSWLRSRIKKWDITISIDGVRAGMECAKNSIQKRNFARNIYHSKKTSKDVKALALNLAGLTATDMRNKWMS